MCLLYVVLLILLSQSYSWTEINRLQPHEVALLQFDSRNLQGYWLASALWNQAYTQRHGHRYIYYNLELTKSCRYGKCHSQLWMITVMHDNQNPGKTLLADAWCKVRAMIQANDQYPAVKLFIYLDSDAVIDKAFVNVSAVTMVAEVQNRLQWNPDGNTTSLSLYL